MELFKTIMKRNGEVQSFDKGRIFRAIEKAFLSESNSDPDTVTRLSNDVVSESGILSIYDIINKEPDIVPLEPDTKLNCLPKLVVVADPVVVTLSSVKWRVPEPLPPSIDDPVKFKFKDPGLSFCLYLALLILIT